MVERPASCVDAGCDLDRVKAGVLVVRRFRGSEQGFLSITLAGRITAARRKRATLNWSGGIRRASRNRRQGRVRSGIDLRYSREPRLAVGHAHILDKSRGRWG